MLHGVVTWGASSFQQGRWQRCVLWLEELRHFNGEDDNNVVFSTWGLSHNFNGEGEDDVVFSTSTTSVKIKVACGGDEFWSVWDLECVSRLHHFSRTQITPSMLPEELAHLNWQFAYFLKPPQSHKTLSEFFFCSGGGVQPSIVCTYYQFVIFVN